MSPRASGSRGSASVLTWACEPARRPPDARELQPELQPRRGARLGCGSPQPAATQCGHREGTGAATAGRAGRRGGDGRAGCQPAAARRPRAVHTGRSVPHARRTPWHPGGSACACRKVRPGHATRRYSLIRPPARVCLRTRYCSRSTGSGSGVSGAAPCSERCGRCWLWWVS